MEGESSHPFPLPVPGQPSPNNFSILYFNARSILSKLDELRVVVAAQIPPIVCIASHGFVRLYQTLKSQPYLIKTDIVEVSSFTFMPHLGSFIEGFK